MNRQKQGFVITIVPGLLLIALLASGVPGQQAKEAAGKSSPEPSLPRPGNYGDENRAAGLLASTDADYRIGIGDVLEVQIEDAPELSGQVRVNNVGNIPLPDPVGMIKGSQKTTEELSVAIATILREKDYLKTPRVMVSVRQYLSRSIFIQGAVRSPGVYQIEGEPSLLKLLVLAGGLAENHGSSAFIIREKKAPESEAAQPQKSGDEQYEFIRTSIAGLMNGNFDQNVKVEPGDIINIPPAGVFFVGGEVHKPGSFVIKDRVTLRQAISLAEGTTFKAALGSGIIFREDAASGQRQEIKVDIGAVMKGKQEDVVIQANDIVIVPDSRMKSVGGAMLSTLGLGAMQRALYFR